MLCYSVSTDLILVHICLFCVFLERRTRGLPSTCLIVSWINPTAEYDRESTVRTSLCVRSSSTMLWATRARFTQIVHTPINHVHSVYYDNRCFCKANGGSYCIGFKLPYDPTDLNSILVIEFINVFGTLQPICFCFYFSVGFRVITALLEYFHWTHSTGPLSRVEDGRQIWW